jgi:hypothetical protein
MHTLPRVALLAVVSMTIVGCGDDGDGGSSAGSGGMGGETDGGGGTGGAGGSGGSGGDGGSGGSGGDGGSDAGGSDTGVPPGARPHPLYPVLDLDTLPGAGGAQSGAYEAPTLPTTTRQVTVSGTGNAARTELLDACQTPGTAVSVPDAAGQLGILDFGNVQDCDVTLGAQVIADLVYVGHLPGPQVAPAQRLRIRGG